MIDWKELGQSALTGAIYGGAAVLVTVQKLDVALITAVAVGVIRGAAIAVVGLLEPKTTSKRNVYESKYTKLKRIL